MQNDSPNIEMITLYPNVQQPSYYKRKPTEMTTKYPPKGKRPVYMQPIKSAPVEYMIPEKPPPIIAKKPPPTIQPPFCAMLPKRQPIVGPRNSSSSAST